MRSYWQRRCSEPVEERSTLNHRLHLRRLGRPSRRPAPRSSSPISAVDSTPSTTQEASAATQSDSAPLKVVEARFLGVGSVSFLSDATAALGVAAVEERQDEVKQPNPAIPFAACLTHPGNHWSIYAGGLTMVFEGESADSAQLTNWQYTGGPIAGFSEMVAPNGIAIGATVRRSCRPTTSRGPWRRHRRARADTAQVRVGRRHGRVVRSHRLRRGLTRRCCHTVCMYDACVPTCRSETFPTKSTPCSCAGLRQLGSRCSSISRRSLHDWRRRPRSTRYSTGSRPTPRVGFRATMRSSLSGPTVIVVDASVLAPVVADHRIDGAQLSTSSSRRDHRRARSGRESR